ncbi:MAG: pancreas/duodenum homeobox protein 1 [Deltaproteobacteria bacterium]|nr:MAG: pancreas/duodenum homeobox protein 1 [Deltaproteobacteria bacterium]
MNEIENILSKEVLADIFPKQRTDQFFEALFGDAEEGAYDIELAYGSSSKDQLTINIVLNERPGHCLVCSLTQGLPQVFAKHPIINLDGVVQKIDEALGNTAACGGWSLGSTEHTSKSIHTIPLHIELQ